MAEPEVSKKSKYSGSRPILPSESVKDEDCDLGDICQVILSFQCKFCTFLCHDKKALTTHFRELHFPHAHFISNPKSGPAEAETETTAPQPQNDQEPNTGVNDRPDEEMFYCSACNVVFNTEDACCTHMAQVHSLLDFNTDSVRDGTKKLKEKMQTEDSLSAPRPSRAVKLPLKYTRQAGSVVQKKYLVTKDSHCFRCTYCNLKFESLEIAQFHEQCHAVEASNGTSLRGYYCLMCLASTNQNQNQGNNASQSSAEPQPEVDPVTFDNWGKCAFHLWKVHKIDCELYGCLHPGCEFKSYYHAKLTEHQAIHSSSLPTFKCETCHKSFKQLKQLRTHEKYHKQYSTNLPPPSESRWYTSKECPICKRVLSDSKCLKKHISAVHNRIKPHICNICGHSSARKAELQLHTRQHSGEKPYKCPSCTFSTGDHNSLRKHKLTHTSSKTYVCKLCSFTCIQSSGFKKHIIAKHPEEDGMLFVCPYCPLISVNKVKYEAHVKDHDEGRIPIVDMDLNNASENAKASTSSGAAITGNNSTETSKPGAGASPAAGASSPFLSNKQRPTTMSKPTTAHDYWLRDDDSLDLIDTGGITIPAPLTELCSIDDDDRSTDSPFLTIDLTDQC